MSYFKFLKPFFLRGRHISSQEDVNSIFLHPEDESVKTAVKDGFLSHDREGWEAASANKVPIQVVTKDVKTEQLDKK